MRHRCFVICPFGHEEGSAEHRRLFNELSGLYEQIFKPAERICESREVVVQIADGRVDDGRHVFGATQEGIDAADAVVVVLTADNPNVFLEFGWAHAMWHEPILLKSEDYELPVDLRSLLYIPFTKAQVEGRDDAGAAKTARLLAAKLMDRIAARRQKKPFDHWSDTLLARGSARLYNRFLKGVSVSDWSSMLQEAEQEIIVASSGMSRIFDQKLFWRDDKGENTIPFGQFLLQKALAGTNVAILMYHEDNVTVDHMKRDEVDPEPIREEVERAFVKWSTLRRTFETIRRAAELKGSDDFVPGGSMRVVQVRQRYLPYRITFTEKRVLLTLRFYTEMFNSGLCVDAVAPPGAVDPFNMPVHMQVRTELQYLLKQNEAQSEKRYQEWLTANRA